MRKRLCRWGMGINPSPGKGGCRFLFSMTNQEFRLLTAYIKSNYGINLKEEKRAMVEGRLHGLLLKNGVSSFSEYFSQVMSDKTGEAVAALVNRITTNHTFFMREPAHFFYLRDKVLPQLASTVRNKDLRIWSAGCSTGEEPYTIAFILDEFFGKEKALWDTRILATDISSSVLEYAAKGVYSIESVKKLPAQWQLSYFLRNDSGYEVVDRIKKEIIFRKFNLMDKVFPFKKKFHIIFCRNVMIYFDRETKTELVNKFYNAMEHGGYLFIGHSESLSRGESPFKYVMPSVYRKE